MKGINLLFIFLISSCSYLERGRKAQPEPLKRVTLLKQDEYLDCVRNSQTYKQNKDSQKGWRVIAQFAIAPDGKVVDPSITNSDFEETALHHCLITQISALTFPGESETKRFRQMLNLDPEQLK